MNDTNNQEKAKIINETLEAILKNIKDEDQLKNFNAIIKRAKSLSLTNQEQLLNNIFEVMEKFINFQDQTCNEKICEYEGHIFGPWEQNKYTKHIDTVINKTNVHDFPVKSINWKRSCARCGFVETLYQDPKEQKSNKMTK